MKSRWPSIVALIALVLSLSTAIGVVAGKPSTAAAKEDGISVYFSPKGGCTDAIVDCIASAKQDIKILAYSFTSKPIAEALLAAHKRGVTITAVLDKSQRTEKYTSATFLANAGINVLIDAKHAIAHNKVILIDAKTIITGSFNFSKAAEESNAENLLIIEGKPELARAYWANFQSHLQHGEPYSRPMPAAPHQD